MNGEFSFTGHGTCQIPSCARVHPRVIWRSIEDDQGTFVVIVHKRVMTALRQQDVILKAQT